MANITVSASSNFDAAANLALTNGADITINSGAVLTCDSDSRWGQNAAVPMTITIDASSGGELFWEGRNVWWVPFSAATGTVPALGSYGVQNVTRGGSSVGEYLGVWAALGVAPSVSGGAMPESGFIKMRSKSAVLAASDVLTIGSCTVTLSSPGQRGWLNVVGAESGTIIIPRLGALRGRGEMFELATTSGARNQSIQYMVADNCPALWIETSPGSGVYDKYLNAGARWSATYVSMDERGKFFGCTAAGVITLAPTGYGKLSPAGCKILVPNIHVSATTSAGSYLTNNVNITTTTRWETSTNNAGTIELEYVCCAGLYVSVASAYSLRMLYSSTFDGMYVTANAMAPYFEEVAVGLSGSVTAYPFDMSNIYVGGTIKKCSAVRYSGSYCIYAKQFPNLIVDGGTFVNFAADGAYGIYIYDGCTDAVVKNATLIGGELTASVSNGVLFKDNKFSGVTVGGASTSGGQSCINVQQGANCVVDGVAIMTDGTPARSYGVYLTSCSGTKVRNIGSYSAPFDCAGNLGRAISISNSVGTKVQRTYFSNTRIELVYNSNSRGTTFESVMGDLTGDPLPNISDSIVKGHFGGDVGALPAIFGGHFYDIFRSATQGWIGLYFNEPTILTAGSVEQAGVQFSATGFAYLRELGDQITYTWPHFILGYTGLANIAPTVSGGNTNFLTIEYDLDKGSGFSGSWKTCNAANLSAETGISATTGFKPKFRFTCATANSANSIYGFYITGTTDETSRQTLYPLDTNLLTLTGIPAGSEVRCYTGAKDGSAVEIGGVENTSGASFGFTHSSGGVAGFIHIIHPNYKIKEIDYTYVTSDTTLLIQMDADQWYSNPA